MIIWRIGGNDDFGDSGSIGDDGAVPSLSFPHPSPTSLPTLHPTTTVSVLTLSSLLPASRGY